MTRGSHSVVKTRILKAAATVAPLARAFGLGSLVTAAARRSNGVVGRTTFKFDGFTVCTSDIGHVYYMCDLMENHTDRYFRELFKLAIPAGGTVLEGGAHIGVMTLIGARAVGDRCHGRVICFEPNAEVLPTLRENINRNGYGARVDIFPLGLSVGDAQCDFYISGGGATSSIHDSGTASHVITITTAPGDDVVTSEVVVDVVKLDVEGHEVAALQGLEKTLSRASDSLTVFAECNPAMLAKAGHTPADLDGALRSQGLTVYWIDDFQNALRPFDEDPPSEGYINLVGLRSSSPLWALVHESG